MILFLLVRKIGDRINVTRCYHPKFHNFKKWLNEKFKIINRFDKFIEVISDRASRFKDITTEEKLLLVCKNLPYDQSSYEEVILDDPLEFPFEVRWYTYNDYVANGGTV